MDFNELIKTAHKNAVEKGFYDEPVDDETLKALIISEAYEALEAHRKGIFLKDKKLLDMFLELGDSAMFKNQIKDTFGDELADVVIRLCDYMGFAKIEYPEYNPIVYVKRKESMGYVVNTIALMVINNHYAECLKYIKIYCEKNNIPLEKHIQAKMMYNLTIPYKHAYNDNTPI